MTETFSDELDMIDNMRYYMEDKLQKNKHKSHWKNNSFEDLVENLRDEVDELEGLIPNFIYAIGPDTRTPEEVWMEAADVANFAAMIADTYERAYNELK